MAAFVRPRAIRVAFLVDESQHWSTVFDAIFADCYSRWGGRFNLIIPCENGAVRPSYLPWLEAYDPDIIYSYVDLTDNAVMALHEQLNPSFLIRHELLLPERDKHAFSPRLPMEGLSSLSVCLIAAHSSPLFGRQQIQLVDAHPGQPDSPFLQDGFGFYAHSMHSWPMGQDMVEYAQTISLTPQKIIDDPRVGPKPQGEAISEESEYLKRIAEKRSLVGLAQLSAWVCPRLELHDRKLGGALNLVVGRSFLDRLMFWNMRSHMPVWLDHDLVTLNVTKENLEDVDFFSALAKIIKNRTHVSPGGGGQSYVCLRSASVLSPDLASLADRLRKANTWKIISHESIASIDDCVPAERTLQHATRHTERTFAYRTSSWHEFSCSGESWRPPTVLPRHLREISPLPVAARTGLWAQDLDIERSGGDSRYSNVADRWRLPRRLRVTDAFSRGYQLPGNGPLCIPRVTSEGMLSCFTAVDGELPIIRLPTDDVLFYGALCNPGSPWPFVSKQDRRTPPIAYEAGPSDKGQFLMALLNRSGGLFQAEAIFLNQFWKEQFEWFGGTPTSTEQRLETVTRTLKKRLREKVIETEVEWNRLAKVVLAEARAVRLSQRYLRYDFLEAEFEKYRSKYWARQKAGAERRDWDQDEKKYLPASVQYLCEQEIFHQGHEWRCRACANNNWVGIDNLKRSMECEVCGATQPAPVDDVWRFKIDKFILEGLRDHGLLASLWCLAKISSKARTSFYFCESYRLFYDEKSIEDRMASAEVDLISVSDGVVRVCEAKSSSGNIDIKKFVDVALRIRPDIATLAVMEEPSNALRAAFAQMERALAGSGVKPELLTLHPGDIDDNPYLPTGRSYRLRVM